MNELSTCHMGDHLLFMQRILLTQTYIWVLWQQLAAALIAPKNKIKNPGYMHEAKTYLLIRIQNTSLHWKTWGQNTALQMVGTCNTLPHLEVLLRPKSHLLYGEDMAAVRPLN